MKTMKWILGLALLLALVTVVQLADPPTDSPATPISAVAGHRAAGVAEAEWAAGRPDGALAVVGLRHRE